MPELEAAQQGYGVLPEGEASQWRAEWTVIGHEGLCGDPLFIDTDDEDYPVYTAERGTGEWNPRLIAFTFNHFVRILQRLQALAQGRDNPVRLKRHPITDSEQASFMEFIRSQSPNIDFDFWETMLQTPDKP